MKKNNTGITLVALVITIIVLIILAGVSINSVMNGGLIDNAKVAKDEFSKTAESEVKGIDSLTLKTDLLIAEANSGNAGGTSENKVIASRGILTGIEKGTTVSELESMLPEGYSVLKADGNGFDDEEKDENGKTEKEREKVGTGMQIVKNSVEVSRVVLYGDIDGDGIISISDSPFRITSDDEDYIKVAADVNFDGIINKDDGTIIAWAINSPSRIDQSTEAQDANKISVETTDEEYYARQIEQIGISDKIVRKEWYEYTNEATFETTKYYYLYVDAGTLTVEDCLENSNDNFTVWVGRGEGLIYTGPIQAGDKIAISKEYVSEGSGTTIFSGIVAEVVINE